MSRTVQITEDEQFHNIPLQTVESHWKNIFDQFDRNGDGKVPLSYFSRKVAANNGDIPPYIIHRIIEKADYNQDGYITYPEFLKLVETHPPAVHSLFINQLDNYVRKFVPRSQRARRDYVDGRYEAEYTCVPPPLLMLLISFIEICVYMYDIILSQDPLSPRARGFVIFIYNPHRRAEVWRYVTYMFIHSNEMHLIVNLLVQIMLGIPLEMVHSWWRILIIYLAGVISGSLFTSICDPFVYLAGASGGVYAIMTAHIATIIMNWTEMDYPGVQLFVFASIGIADVGNAIYYRYIVEIDTKIGYAAHLAGAVSGFLVGVYILRNLKVRRWEVILWRISCILFCAFLIVAISWNVLFPEYFPSQYPFGQQLFFN